MDMVCAGDQTSTKTYRLSSADAVLSTRVSSFSIINFKLLFVLVFVRLVLTALQVVLSFHQLRNSVSSSSLYIAVFAVSVVKLVLSHKVTTQLLGARGRFRGRRLFFYLVYLVLATFEMLSCSSDRAPTK